MVLRNRLLDSVIPFLLGSFITFCSYLSVYHIGIGWFYIHEGRSIVAAVYTTAALALTGLTLLMHVRLVLHEAPSPPAEVPPEILERRVIYECVDERGSVASCSKDQCNGRWKPSRTHHCSRCRSCHTGFDHRCSWVGNCITMETRKLFVAFLALATITVPSLVLPVYQPLWRHAVNAFATSRENDEIRSYWWDRWWSWVLFAGPIGRIPFGTALGFRLLQARRDSSGSQIQSGYMISEPKLTIFVTVQMAIALAFFTAAMFMLSIRDVLMGNTTFDRLIAMPHGTSVWIPDRTASEVSGRVIGVPRGLVNLYDLGYRRNLADLMERPVFGPLLPYRDIIPKINQEALFAAMAKQRVE